MSKYEELYLFLTETCPNRCKYCYIKYKDEAMNEQDIDKYLAHYNPQRVIFFGGEPLDRLDLLEYTVMKYYGKIKFQVVTSTCSNFREFLDFNKKYPLDEIQLSWDGWSDSRVDQHGKSIADKVYDNILYAASTGLKFDVKTVINNENIQDLLELHSLFKDWIKLGINGQFVIAHGENYTENFYTELDRQLPLTFDLDKMYHEHMNKLNAYLIRDDYATCDVGKYTTVDPRGNENYCTALSQFDIDLGFQKIQERCKHSDCQNCEHYYMCNGGCVFERYVKYKDKWQYNYLPATCKITKTWIKSIEYFLNSLSQDETNILIDMVYRYKDFIHKRYFFNM